MEFDLIRLNSTSFLFFAKKPAEALTESRNDTVLTL